MEKGFDWVPFFEEMAQKLRAYRGKQHELIEVLRRANVKGLDDENPKGTKIPLAEVDPFTFFALLNKHGTANRQRILEVVKPALGITAPLPQDFSGVPTANPLKVWYFPYLFEKNPGDMDTLWDLFEDVVSGREIDDAVFERALQIKSVGFSKMTQGIFRAAPRKFFPIDIQTRGYLASLGIQSECPTASAFQDLCLQVSQKEGKPLYQQSHDAWAANQPSALSYQEKVQRAAAKSTEVHEPQGGVAPKRIVVSSTKTGYQRNDLVAGDAVRNAGYKCEINAEHKTFVSKSTGMPYIEAHHLIPFSKQGSFSFSLDVKANIVALCPTCHRKLHHGRDEDKVSELKGLYSHRKDRLREKQIEVTERELLGMYSKDLSDEDD